MPLVAVPTVVETRFAAMGSDVHLVVVDGPADACAVARGRIEQLEARWSRFRPTSELCRINAAAGRPVLVSHDTVIAIAAAVDGWRATAGRFDPTILPVLVAAGYDRDFAEVARFPTGPTSAGKPMPASGCGGIAIDRTVGAVTLPAGIEIDLGGIGKGLAADLVVAELIVAGAAGACVNVGGDLRVRGVAPTRAGWVVDVEHLPDLRIALADGAIATSSSWKRRWERAGRTVHHLIDPSRGTSADAGIVAVSVIAGAAADAEVLTKAAFVAGAQHAGRIIEDAGATGLLVTRTGTVIELTGLDGFLR